MASTHVVRPAQYVFGGSTQPLTDLLPDPGQQRTVSICHRIREYCLATKCGCTDGKGHVWPRDNLLRNIKSSPRRLNTDYVDVWQLHNAPVEEVAAGNLVQVMEEVRRAGKVR